MTEYPSAESSSSWTADDALLYALAVGAGEHDEERAFTTETSEAVRQQVVPSFASLIAQRAARPLVAEFDLSRAVHVGQSIRLEGALPTDCSVALSSAVASVERKSSGTLISYETTLVSDEGSKLASTTSQVFVREAHPSQPASPIRRPIAETTDRPPDEVRRYPTSRGQALLYRLCGDRNPLHSDPAVAERAGFSGPILHGLCTYGYACRALVQTLCGGEPERFGEMSARFVGPVYPGESLEVSVWRDADASRFTVTAGDGNSAITHGVCRLRD